jgi:hypothetical protein
MGNKILVEMALWRIFCKVHSTGLEAACQVRQQPRPYTGSDALPALARPPPYAGANTWH